MIRQIDHMVIFVAELDQASADYTALGFTVVRGGGDHPGGATHNALVSFGDDTYFELIAFKQPAPEHRWWPKSRAGEGLLDFALLPGAIAEDITAARKQGLALEGPTSGGRLRPDGVTVAWQSARAATTDLPFLCFDVTPRALRVPEGAARRHANGATGIAGITVAVTDLDRSIQRYRSLLCLAAQEERATRTEGGIRSAGFQLGDTTIMLVQPAGTGAGQAAALHTYLVKRGEGPYAVALRGPDTHGAGPLDTRLTHGAHLEFGTTAPAVRP